MQLTGCVFPGRGRDPILFLPPILILPSQRWKDLKGGESFKPLNAEGIVQEVKKKTNKLKGTRKHITASHTSQT